MQTVGIDLATEPSRTAVCTVSWDGSTAVADFLTDKPANDEALVAACRTADKVGIDCPFGWPEPFVAALVGHQDKEPWPGRGVDFRRSLAYRETDRHVRDKTEAWPLSVSANLIGLTAMCCAALLDDLAPVDRAGTGRVAEVYPAAALRVWKLWRPSYKQVAGRVVLGTMLDGLQSHLPLQFAPGAEQVCRRSHDAFDALIAALVARAAACGLTTPPQTAEQRRLAGIEGWIHLPTGRLRELTGAERDTGA